MEAFCLFNNKNECERELELVKHVLTENGFDAFFDTFTSQSIEADLTSARLLIILALSDSDFSDRTLSDRWRFFQNELRWKRKAIGDILIVLGDAVDEKRIPLTLRDLPFAKISDGKEKLNKKLYDIVSGEAPSPINRVRESAGELALRLAAEQSSNSKLDRNGCKKSHVFESGTKTRTPYLERLSEILEKKREREAVQKRETDGQFEISIDTSDMDKAIKEIERDVKSLDNEAKSALAEIDEAALRLSKSDVQLSFRGSDTKIPLKDKPDEERQYYKGNERYQPYEAKKTSTPQPPSRPQPPQPSKPSSPFGDDYNRPHSNNNNNNKKKENAIGIAIAVGAFIFFFVMILINAISG